MALTKVTGSVIKDSVSLSGNVSVGGTLTYQDVTNVDALGIGTFRTGIKVLAGQVDVGSNIKLGNAGIITATSFSGSGANLTSLPAANITGTLPAISGANLTSLPAQATIANNADNRVITGGSGVNLNGEANLTFNGTTLGLTGNQTVSGTIQVAGNSNFGAAAASPSPSALTVKMATNKHIGFSPSQSEVGDVPALVAFQDNGSLNSIGFRGTDARFATGSNERLRITSSGTVAIGGDYTQTANVLYVQGTPGIKAQGGSASSGNAVLLELKHSDTASSTSGGGAGDGPAMLFNGYYAGNPWQFAKVCSVNSGSGYGAEFEIHVHPSNGTQGASLVKALTILGNGSAGNVTIHNGTLYTTYNGSSMYGAQINDSQTSGTHIQFQRQGYNNGNITHSTNSCAYNTSGSDRTLKKNFEDWTENTLDLFKSLKPQKFHFLIDEDSDPKCKGYIAQDLVDSFPEAYPKEVKSDKYMFNPSGMVPYLMKALQEAIAKIETLEAKVAALEGS